MADEPKTEAPAATASPVPEATVDPGAGQIPVSEIVGLSGSAPVDPAQTTEGTLLTGDEELKSKVTVRTRYPVDRLEAGDTVVTASGVKVEGSKLGNLVKAARSAGTELERI